MLQAMATLGKCWRGHRQDQRLPASFSLPRAHHGAPVDEEVGKLWGETSSSRMDKLRD